MADDWKTAASEALENCLASPFSDEDDLADWDLKADELASALLMHPVLRGTKVADLNEALAVLSRMAGLDEQASGLAATLQKASKASSYGFYAEGAVDEANDTADALCSCITEWLETQHA